MAFFPPGVGKATKTIGVGRNPFKSHNSLGRPICAACGSNPRSPVRPLCGKCIRDCRPIQWDRLDSVTKVVIEKLVDLQGEY